MKKQIARGMVIMLGILAMLTGCTREEIPEYHGETEYFQYAYVLSTGDSPAMSFAEENGKYVGKYVGIGELTELGKQQKELIIPKMIDGMQVIYLNYYISKLYFPREKYIASDVLEKIYLPNTIKEIHDSVEGGLYSCPNLKAVIYNSICSFRDISGYTLRKATLYVPSKYQHVFDADMHFESRTKIASANVSYHLNYEEAENGGYWWIDNLAGESQLKEPEEPTREGYEFGGWYKESECVTAWNFDEDRTENEEIDEEGNVIFRETELYAKWLPKDEK